MKALRITSAPIVTIEPEATVMDAVRIMHQARAGAVAIVSEGRLLGMFTERDVVFRVVLEKRDPETTVVGNVMTTNVVTIPSGAKPDDAVSVMWERRVPYLPVVAADGTVEGVVEVRNLFHERVEDLSQELDWMHAYYTSDALGG